MFDIQLCYLVVFINVIGVHCTTSCNGNRALCYMMDETSPTINGQYLKSMDVDVVDEMCNYITANCPALRSTRMIPSKDGAATLTMAFIPLSFIKLDDLTQTLSVLVDLRTYWRLPDCAKWINVTNFGNEVSDELNQRAEAGKLPLTCEIPKANMSQPLLVHDNNVYDLYIIEK